MEVDSTSLSTGKKRFGNSECTPGNKKPRVVMKDHKLIPRMREYLENNRDKQYIDIEDMSQKLHSKYPEYNRQKLRQFRQTVERAFEKLQQKKTNRIEDDDEEEEVVEDVKQEEVVESSVESKSGKEKKKNVEEPPTPSMNDTINNLYAKKEDSAAKSETTPFEKIQEQAQNLLNKSIELKKKKETEDSILKKKNETEESSNKKKKVFEEAESIKRKKEFIDETGTIKKKKEADELIAKKTQPSKTLASFKSKSDEVYQGEEVNAKTPKVNKALDGIKTNGTPQNQLPEENGLCSSSPIKASKPKAKKDSSTNSVGQLSESKVTFDDVGGNDSTLSEICTLIFHLRHPEIYDQLGVSPPRGFLLHGPPGCGKTLMAHAIAGEIRLPFIKVPATEIVSGVSGESENKIRDIFDRASSNAPCVLFIDEIDAVTQKRENAQREMEKRIVSQLLMCMDELDRRVLVIGATNRPDSLDPALRRAGRFDREIPIGIPDEKSRVQIINVLIKGLTISEDVTSARIARKTPGYVGADLKALVREASVAAINRIFQDIRSKCVLDSPSELDGLLEWIRSDPEDSFIDKSQLLTFRIESHDFDKALKIVQPSSKREGFITIPDVTWDDVGALKNIREELDLAILAPVNHPRKFEELGLTAPAGILLCGPPGCGKTLLAKAVANQAGINFISVKGPELLNMYVGESERAVRQVFLRARHSSPCVIFFDELDALCPKRSSNATNDGSSRIVNQLLTEMDGIESRKNVYIMAATNRVDIIDSAILRPGRLDKILFVDLPTESDREEIFKAITKNGSRPAVDDDVSFKNLSKETEGYTGADLSALVREASIFAYKEYSLRPKTLKRIPTLVADRHFRNAKNKIRPSISEGDKKRYEAMKTKYTAVNGCSEEMIPFLIEEEFFNVDDLRFLPDMEVRVKDTFDELGGKNGVVLSSGNQGKTYSVRVSDGTIGDVPREELEPFTPGLNERAKLLTTNGRVDDGLVIRYDEDEDDDVTICFGEDESVVVPIDHLCKVE